jgi:hypothetical protein
VALRNRARCNQRQSARPDYRELAQVRRRREEMLQQAYTDEFGRRIFMTGDKSAAYYEDGAKVSEEEFASLRERLEGRPTWEQWDEQAKKEDGLLAEREAIHRHDGGRSQLREDLASGAISAEEAREREAELEAAMPDRMRRSYDQMAAKEHQLPAGNDDAAPGPQTGDTTPAFTAPAFGGRARRSSYLPQ